ncbi:MAG: GNAT family N-acetyltransferase, partial [Thermoplasmata archaeon]
MTHEERLGSPELRKTEDYDAVRALALRSGLEDGTFENIVMAYGYYIGDELFGCAALKREGERYAVAWLAVSETLRRKGVGRLLVRGIETEARMRGADRIWALARAPRFFERIGFRIASSGESAGPTMSNCLLCSQYQRTCFP